MHRFEQARPGECISNLGAMGGPRQGSLSKQVKGKPSRSHSTQGKETTREFVPRVQVRPMGWATRKSQ